MKRVYLIKVYFYLLCLTAIFVLSSCSPAQVNISTPTPEADPTAVVEAGYPAPGETQSALDISKMYPSANDPNFNTVQTPEASVKAAEPEPGMASISGMIFSDTIDRVIPDTMFYLTPAIGEQKNEIPPAFVGPVAENGDIVGKTDKEGQFSINNIPPGSYVLVVEAPYNWSVGQIGENIFEPLIIKADSDQKTDLGVVFVSWP